MNIMMEQDAATDVENKWRGIKGIDLLKDISKSKNNDLK